jgi:predicted ferric reductase
MSVTASELGGSARRTASRRAARPSRVIVRPWDIGLLLVANVVLVIGLWLRSGGLPGSGSAGDVLTSAGRITGLIGTLLVLVELLLLARLPVLERSVGFDRLTVWHRHNGRAALGLLLAHAVLITVGYALRGKISVPAEIKQLLLSTPGILTATAGTLLLVAVVATSVVIARRHLRYETWYFVHLYSYLGIALAFSHQLAVGTSFIGDTAAQAYWWTIYGATLGALLMFRIVVPFVRNLRHGLRVESVVQEGPGVVSLTVTGRRLDRLGARAGQFFLWRFLTKDAWWQSHPFSLSAVPDGRRLRITVKALGDFTERIGAIRPGTRVVAEGPFGHFTADEQRRRGVALIAGGVGITPIRGLLEELAPGSDITLLYRVVDAQDAVLLDELHDIAAARRAKVHVIAGDHRHPAARHLLSATHLRRLMPDIAGRDVFLCGPPAMADATEASLRAAGVPRTSIHTERFAF